MVSEINKQGTTVLLVEQNADGQEVGTWSDPTFPQGRLVLGIFQSERAAEPPFSVSFAKIEIWAR